MAVPHTMGLWFGYDPEWPKIVALSAITLASLHLADLYRPDLDFGTRELSARIFLAVVGAAVLMAALGFAIPTFRLGRLVFFQIFGSACVGLLLSRATWDRLHSG